MASTRVIVRESGEFSKMGKQMRSRKTETVHSSTAQETSWCSINWKKARCEVRRLQMRIAKAVKEGRYGKVKALQWTLPHSFYAGALAMRRVMNCRAALIRSAF